MNTHKVIGKNVKRIDAVGKVTGKSKYANDLKFDHMIYGKCIRSPHPHAKIKNIDISNVKTIPGVVAVLTAKDVPGKNRTGAIIKDQPILVEDKVRMVGDPVVLVGAESEEIAEKAADMVHIEYERLEPVIDIIKAVQDDSPKVHEGDNVAFHTKIRKGDVEEGFKKADIIIEGVYKTQRVEHAYLEPEAALAKMEPNGDITIWTCTQYTHHDRKEIAEMLGLSINKVRIIQTVTGGGFGGKYANLIPQALAALLAFCTKRPAKVVYTRDESISTTIKRHPFVIEYKTGATKEGKLLATEVKIIGDTGAYMIVGAGVLRRAAIHATGPYFVPNVKIDAYTVYTNNSPSGAMRGYGVPQVAFACEMQMDKLAKKLNMDPVEIRLKNALDKGGTTATGQVLKQSIGIKRCLRKAEKFIKKIKEEKKILPHYKKRGVGIAASWHGIGSTRRSSQSIAFVKLLADGSADVICGSVDIGQGSDTIFAQIAAEELGIPIEKVRVITTDTAVIPDCECTSASRVTYISGRAVEFAAKEVKRILFERLSEDLGEKPENLCLEDGYVYAKNNPEKKLAIGKALKEHAMQGVSTVGYFSPQTVSLDPETGQGIPHGTYAFVANVAEVEVDTQTGKVEVIKLLGINDVGKAINPLSVEGQIEGGLSMGIGYALTEEIKTDDGKIINSTFVDYRIPTATDIQKLLSEIVEETEPTGPYGAKGVGEPATNATAAAILNAIYDATGVRITELPATPEKVFKTLKNSNQEEKI